MEHLKLLRRNAGFKSAKEAALALGISMDMLYSVEQGRKKPSIKIAGRMCKLYKCTFDDIFLPYVMTKCHNVIL